MALAPARSQHSRHQRDFLNSGGVFRMVLEHKYETGELVRPEDYVHQDYPKALNISLGVREVSRATDMLRGKDVVVYEWTEKREVFADLVVQDAAEEAATLAAVIKAKEMGLEIDPMWDAAQLRQIVKQAAPEAHAVAEPEGDDLKAQVATLATELAELKAQREPKRSRAAPSPPSPLLAETE